LRREHADPDTAAGAAFGCAALSVLWERFIQSCAGVSIWKNFFQSDFLLKRHLRSAPGWLCACAYFYYPYLVVNTALSARVLLQAAMVMFMSNGASLRMRGHTGAAV
jgi:hypothetical protein